MDSLFHLFLMYLLLNVMLIQSLSLSLSSSPREKLAVTLDDNTTINVQSTRLLDLMIRDYTVKLLNKMNFKTGVVNNVHLPINLSGIEVDTVRFRCGSLKRYGAKIKEFHLSKGIGINPCIERVILIREKLGLNWSTMYYNNYYKLQGYELITPIIGLLAYNGGDDDNQSISNPNPFELGLISIQSPIKVDFTHVTKSKALNGEMPYCAIFEGKEKVTLANMVSPNFCTTTKHGHIGLVVEAAPPIAPVENTKKISGWKIALGSSVGATLGAFLLGLLLVAMFVKAKKRSKYEEMVRRTYEEEALQVSMVGHVRAPIASSTRTTPIIERDYRPPFS